MHAFGKVEFITTLAEPSVRGHDEIKTGRLQKAQVPVVSRTPDFPQEQFHPVR